MTEEFERAIKFVNDSELAPAGTIQGFSLMASADAQEDKDRGKYLGEPGKNGAAVIGPNLVSVHANLTGMNRRDVADHLEFASRYAKKKCDDELKPEFWKYMKDSLSQTGWFVQSAQTSSTQIGGATFGEQTMKDYVINVVKEDPIYSDAEKDLVANSLNALAKQQKVREFFRPFTAAAKHGQFSVATVSVTGGALALRMSGFYFESGGSVEDYIIVKLNTINAKVSKSNTDYGANQGTLDYVRKGMEDKLKKQAGDFINSVDISRTS